VDDFEVAGVPVLNPWDPAGSPLSGAGRRR